MQNPFDPFGIGYLPSNQTPSQPAYNPYAQVTPNSAGVVGSGGGPGKGGGILGIGDENVQYQLAQSGYKPYTVSPAPDLSQYFQTDPTQQNQFRQGELDLMNTLHGQALGTGPSAAIGTLQTGRDQTMANLMSAISAGRGSPGTAAPALGAGAMASQQAANQAAIIRAQEQAHAQSQLGDVMSGARSGDLTLEQLKASQAGNLGGILNNNWQFGQQANLGQQEALNNVIAQAVAGANASQQSLLPTAINALAGVGGAAASSLGKTPAAAAAHGAVVDKPTVMLAGEAGREAIVPIHQDGTPDMARATDPKLKWILESHAKDSYAVPGSKASGMPGAMPQADHGILGAIVALLHDVQNPARAR